MGRLNTLDRSEERENKKVCAACVLRDWAQADIVLMLVGSGGVNRCVQSGVWGCDYSYTAQLHDRAMLTADQSKHDEYFTIYDFNGYIAGSAVARGSNLWDISEQDTNITPSHIALGADDDPLIANVAFTYVGTADVAGGSELGTFILRSRFGPDVTGSHFTSQATHRIVSPNSPSWIQNIGPSEAMSSRFRSR